MTSVLIVLVLVVIGVFGALARSRSGGKADSKVSGVLPDTLPVTVKRSFFSRSELAFFSTLTAVLEGTPYTVFPNVRLNDLFTIGGDEKRSTYNRLRDKHVDFLIVSRGGFVPTLALELDGASHENEVQQKRDQVKDLVFRSAGLTLLRLDARQPHPSAALAELLVPHLRGLDGPRAGLSAQRPTGLEAQRVRTSRARP